jgi:chromosome segregation ATPase
MDKELTAAISEVMERHRENLVLERDDIEKSLAEKEKEKPSLESRAAEKDGDPILLRELEELSASISRDRWRREWLTEQIAVLDQISEEIGRAAAEVETKEIEAELEQVRAKRIAIDEQVPELERQIEELKSDIPRLETVIVELTRRLAALRKELGLVSPAGTQGEGEPR